MKLPKFTQHVTRYVNRFLLLCGYSLRRLNDEERRYLVYSSNPSSHIPDDAEKVLSLENPGLKELRSAYSKLDLPVTEHSIWNDRELKNQLSLPWFRGDNAYVWQIQQLKSEVRIKQYLALKYIKSRDKLGLLSILEEDGSFGCWTFQYSHCPAVSRDLLDSINEINFLNKHLELSNKTEIRVLDIGAGYGRLAHRMCSALPSVVRYDCVDSVPESTFLCDYYLRYRNVSHVARSIPLHEIERYLSSDGYDLAVNIHSFSECTLASVRWWLSHIVELKVPYMLIIPNDSEELLTSEIDGSRIDFSGEIEAVGYKLWVKEPVYDDKDVQDLTGVLDHFFLFKLSDG